MNHLFKNLQPYEILLTVMGIVAFLVLIFLLIWIVVKGRSVAALLPFFIIPIVMVGYPTVKSIKIGGIIVEVNDQAKIVQNNPGDPVAVKNLKASLEELKNRAGFSTNGNALLASANAQIALGEYDSASLYLNKAEKINPNLKGISATQNDLKEKLMIQKAFSSRIDELNTQIGHLEQVPGDTKSIDQIVKTLANIQVPVYVNSNEAMTLAKSYAIVGNQKQSLQIINKLNNSDGSPNTNINSLKDSIQNKTYLQQFYPPAVVPKIPATTILHDQNLLDKTVIKKAQ